MGARDLLALVGIVVSLLANALTSLLSFSCFILYLIRNVIFVNSYANILTILFSLSLA